MNEQKISIRQRINEHRKLIDFSHKKIEQLRKECPHPRVRCYNWVNVLGKVFKHIEICTECDDLVKEEGEDTFIGKFTRKEWEEDR